MTIAGIGNRHRWCNERTVLVPRGGRFSVENDGCADGGTTYLWIAADLSNPQLSEVIIQVKQFSRVTDAQWRIPIVR